MTQGREVARGKTGIVFIDPGAPRHPIPAAPAAAASPPTATIEHDHAASVSALPGGVEGFLADEVHGLTGLAGQDLLTLRGGVRVRGDWAWCCA
jgi:hypothetical protein